MFANLPLCIATVLDAGHWITSVDMSKFSVSGRLVVNALVERATVFFNIVATHFCVAS
jgi:hypothetical protein